MKKIAEAWITGWGYLLGDELISFNAYFTIIFAEVAYLFTYQPHLALPFTTLFAFCIANVCICSYVKGFWEGTKIELITSRIYVINFVLIFILGCLFHFKGNIILMFLPFLVTGVCVFFRENDPFWGIGYHFAQKKNPLSKLLCILCKIASPILQLLVVFGPSLIFAFLLFKTTLPLHLIITILTLLFISMPFFAQMEDDFSACTIFEIAYDVYYNPSRDK